jgi:hypothetical protein
LLQLNPGFFLRLVCKTARTILRRHVKIHASKAIDREGSDRRANETTEAIATAAAVAIDRTATADQATVATGVTKWDRCRRGSINVQQHLLPRQFQYLSPSPSHLETATFRTLTSLSSKPRRWIRSSIWRERSSSRVIRV